MKDGNMITMIVILILLLPVNGMIIKNEGGCSKYPLWFPYMNKDVCKECSKFKKCQVDYYCRRCCKIEPNDENQCILK